MVGGSTHSFKIILKHSLFVSRVCSLLLQNSNAVPSYTFTLCSRYYSMELFLDCAFILNNLAASGFFLYISGFWKF